MAMETGFEAHGRDESGPRAGATPGGEQTDPGERQRLLAEVSRAFAEATPDYEQLLRVVAERIALAIGDACTLWLLSEDRQWLRAVACHHPDPTRLAAIWAVMRETTQRTDTGIWGPIINEGRSIRLAVGQGAIPPGVAAAQAAFIREHPLSGILGVPLLARGDVLGGISLVRYGDRPTYTTEDETFLRDLADHAALALDNAQRYRTALAKASGKDEALAFLDMLFSNAPAGLGFFDRELRFRRVNEALAAMNGLSPDRHIGQRLDAIAPALAPMVEPLLRRVLATGQAIIDIEVRGETPAQPGEERQWLTSYYPARMPSGETIGVGVIGREVTVERRAARALAFRARQGAALAELGRRALRAIDLDVLFGEAVATVAAMLDLGYVKVLQLEPDGAALRLRAGIGWREGLIGHATVATGPDSQAGHTLVQDKPILVEDLASERRFHGMPLLHEHGIKSGMTAIIGGKERPYGILGAHTTVARRFTPDDANFLQAVANILSDAIEHAQSEALLRALTAELEARVAERTTSLATSLGDLQREMGERRRAEARFRSVLDSAPDAIVTIDVDGQITLANAQAERIFGYERAALLGQSVDVLAPAQLRAAHSRHRAAYVADPHTRSMGLGLELFGQRRDGTAFPVEISLSPVASGDMLEVIAIIRDVTAREEAARQLREMTAELVRSNRELEQFAYVASHDLQEPLRMVSAYTQLLARRYHGKLDADADEFIGYAVDGAQRMQHLIRDLLAYSRVGTHVGAFVPVDTGGVIDEVLSDLGPTIAECGGTVTHEMLPHISGDRSQFRQLFQNLIGNALKYRRANAAPAVRVGAALEGNQWHFTVSDNGIGIAPEYAERIFVIFQRLHTQTEYIGTGIGLAICKKIVERHGGKIWVESILGAGTTFHFTVPVPREETRSTTTWA
jgi:PAS domain S-box-containing protein